MVWLEKAVEWVLSNSLGRMGNMMVSDPVAFTLWIAVLTALSWVAFWKAQKAMGVPRFRIDLFSATKSRDGTMEVSIILRSQSLWRVSPGRVKMRVFVAGPGNSPDLTSDPVGPMWPWSRKSVRATLGPCSWLSATQAQAPCGIALVATVTDTGGEVPMSPRVDLPCSTVCGN